MYEEKEFSQVRGADGAAVLTVALARAVRATGREPQRSTGAY